MFDQTPNMANSGTAIIGWDIGGANIKAARLTKAGLQVTQQSFPIWQRRDNLSTTLAAMAVELGPAQRMGITMTAELSDAFRTKREGVTFVLDAVQTALPYSSIQVWGIDGQFHDPAAAYDQPLLVAAANWMATATLVSRYVSTCILVDIGSTTTDIIPIVDGQVAAHGRTDPERLLRGELLYTGALRTPVFAIMQRVPLWGGWCPVAAEYFATAQDVHQLLGNLSNDQCSSPTADGRPATVAFAAERLARIVCADSEMLSDEALRVIAQHVAAEQVQQIAAAIAQVVSGSGVNGPLLAAGVGTFLVREAAARLALECLDLAAPLGNAASYAAPAAALAMLLDEDCSNGQNI
jgi:probable H4MPT-linked C1 transfer pathway protein